MPPVMNRIFLALLALFAGIAAQPSTADARVRGETEIGAMLGQRSVARAPVAIGAVQALRPERPRAEPASQSVRPNARPAPVVPTVRLGPDRARE